MRQGLPSRIFPILFLAATATAFLGALCAAERSAWSATLDCLSCHDDHLFRAEFPKSVHGDNSCTSCHTGITNEERHSAGEERPAAVHCGSCHEEIARRYRQNFHYVQLDFRCSDCHRDIHSFRPRAKKTKAAIIEKCTECHANEEYVASGHAEAGLKGNEDA
ncbi:MAG TPA: hypothetical protein PLB96_11395, partial [Syntrophales bacterium]|nr:hypothetical protein [Syntrophales bacterium]